jgi:putative NIF3 family GTP cyclohydrolase 1 type 2
MKPIDFLNHCKEVGTWVDWDNTVDQIMHGDPEVEVRSIAVTWLATNDLLREAAKRGHNFVVSHEGAFYPAYAEIPNEAEHHAQKHKLLDELGITLMRCHDTWDYMPAVGICDSWADFFGFPTEPRPVKSPYRICLTGGITVSELIHVILKKTTPLGQSDIGVMGNPAHRVHRMAVGTGAITRASEMGELNPDVILATEGSPTAKIGLWSLDKDIPVLLVYHSTAELPGMMNMAKYIPEIFPNVRTEYMPCGFPYPRLNLDAVALPAEMKGPINEAD